MFFGSYTGTQVCNDPERKIITILLTNRCYKDDSEDSKLKIAFTRRKFNNAVKEVVDNCAINYVEEEERC